MSLHPETYGLNRKNLSSAADRHSHFQEGWRGRGGSAVQGQPDIGFTVIELLLVVSITTVPASFLLPAVCELGDQAGDRVRAALTGHPRQVDPGAGRPAAMAP